MRLGITLSGGQIRYEEAVTKITRDSASYTISCGDTRIQCRQLVSAAGPFTSTLLRNIAPEFQDIVQAKRVPLAYFKPKEASYSRLSNAQKHRLRDAYPMSTMDSPSYFTMIERWEDDRPVIKMGGHWMRSDIHDLDTVWDQELSNEEKQTFLEQTVHYLQSNRLPLDADDLEYVQGYSCVYTLTEDEVPTVRNALLPDGSADPNFIVIAGLSGRGANGTLGYGLLATDLLCGRSGDTSPMYVKSRKVLNGEIVLDNSLIKSAMSTVG
jgi:glycine/D-amino acid oxidase-like deaminating enzyme